MRIVREDYQNQRRRESQKSMVETQLAASSRRPLPVLSGATQQAASLPIRVFDSDLLTNLGAGQTARDFDLSLSGSPTSLTLPPAQLAVAQTSVSLDAPLT